MFGLTISASISYVRIKYVNFRLAFLYEILAIPGVIFGGIMTLYVLDSILAGICGLVMIALGFILLTKKEKDHNSACVGETIEEEITEDNNRLGVNNPYLDSAASFSGGMVASMVGLGCGTIKTSSMILCGLESKKAVGTCEFSMVFTTAFAIFFHSSLGSFSGDWLWPILMSMGAIIGAQFGVILCSRVKAKFVIKLFSVIVLYSGFLMILLMFGIGWV